ncbi:MAG TPA: methylmalonyl Co-A mutase-associated GTPase MeaB [Candidatus Acidoferrales bacterium]
MRASAENWAAQICSGDVRAISRAVSAIENGDPEASSIVRELFASTGRAWRIGITGAAGTGKSTLVSGLAAHYRAQGKTVGIIAVDPSSPFTGGAILGDRIRMQSHATDDGVFIRSMAARGAWGGLAQAAADAALLLDAAGKDIIILETVGVGQDEVDVVRVADCTLVVLVPGSGDEVQGLKAGLMEIADIFVLNKADYENAAHFEEQLASVLHLAPPREGWTPKIVRTVATEEKGIAELAREVELFRESQSNANSRRAKETEYWESWLIRAVQHRVTGRLTKATNELKEAADAVASREKDPYAAAEELSASLGLIPQGKHT